MLHLPNRDAFLVRLARAEARDAQPPPSVPKPDWKERSKQDWAQLDASAAKLFEFSTLNGKENPANGSGTASPMPPRKALLAWATKSPSSPVKRLTLLGRSPSPTKRPSLLLRRMDEGSLAHSPSRSPSRSPMLAAALAVRRRLGKGERGGAASAEAAARAQFFLGTSGEGRDAAPPASRRPAEAYSSAAPSEPQPDKGPSTASERRRTSEAHLDGVERRVSQAIERKRHGKGHNRSRHTRTQQSEVSDARRRSKWEQPPPWAAERDEATSADARANWRRAGGAVQAARAFAAAGSRRRAAEQASADPALVHALLDTEPELTYDEAERKLRAHGWSLQAAVAGVAAGGVASTAAGATCKTHVEATRQRRQRSHTRA